MATLVQIDELLMRRHSHLEPTDVCFKIMDYKGWRKFGPNPVNRLIMDFKIDVNSSSNRIEVKKRAINSIAEILNDAFPTIKNELFFIPVPPSKKKTDPLYDDRMIKVLMKFCELRTNANLCEAISCKESMPASHLSPVRPSMNEIFKNLQINNSIDLNNKNVIIIDDVIRDGAHFKACQRIISAKFQTRSICGVFLGSNVPS